jgi:hypothetical protein
VPWCDPCERYYAPNALTTEGDCPTCGEHIDDPDDPADPKVPWHFWLLLVAAVVYLGWRLVQGIMWAVG